MEFGSVPSQETMTTTPAGYFRDIVGEFIKKEFSEKHSEAYQVLYTATTNRPIQEHSRSFSLQIFRSYPGHTKGRKGAFEPQTINPEEYVPSSSPASNSISGKHVDHFNDRETVPGVAHPGATGVIYCTDRAMANGFSYSNGEWVSAAP